MRIEYASILNQDYSSFITFQQKNVIRFRPDDQYDLIWAAGLFDYFADDVFKAVVRRLLPAIGDGGELVIGNFASTNPSRAYMEFGGWVLHHRTPEDLIAIAKDCGVAENNIRVGSESENVNLFLHITHITPQQIP